VFGLIGLIARELLASGTSLIVEGNFNRDTPFEDLPDARIVQIHVSAAPEVLRARMLDRDTHRHSVHYDREAAHEVAARAAAGEWNPIALPGRLLSIDTTTWPDLDEALAGI
jgi:hypothetical protein